MIQYIRDWIHDIRWAIREVRERSQLRKWLDQEKQQKLHTGGECDDESHP